MSWKVKYGVATLPYSNVYFATAYPVERLEALLDGIQAAVAYLGGVTDRVVLDEHDDRGQAGAARPGPGADRCVSGVRGTYPFATASWPVPFLGPEHCRAGLE